MAVSYVTKQNKRKGGNQMWYGRAVHPATISTKQLAETIQRACSITRSDVVGVITMMVEIMKEDLQNGKKVELDELGTFRIKMQSGPAVSAKDFRADRDIKVTTCSFLPKGFEENGQPTRTFLDGVQYKKAE